MIPNLLYTTFVYSEPDVLPAKIKTKLTLTRHNFTLTIA